MPPNSRLEDAQTTNIEKNPTPEEEGKALSENQEERTTRLQNDSLQQNIEERRKYAERAYWITLYWICGLGFIVLLQMIPRFCYIQQLTEKEFITLVTTTTAAIFGFWYLVMKYLFPKPPQEKK